MYVGGIRFFELGRLFPMLLVRGLFLFGLVGFCIPLLADQLDIVWSLASGTDISGVRFPL